MRQEPEAVKVGETAISYKSIDTDKLQGGDNNYQLDKKEVLVNKHDLAMKEIRKVYNTIQNKIMYRVFAICFRNRKKFKNINLSGA